MSTPKIPKRVRKAMRARRRIQLRPGYRKNCLIEIKRMRALNVTAEVFRAALKQLRHDFSRQVAGKAVRA